MIWKTVLHYARFGLILTLVSSQLTEKQKEEILNLHNIYRSVVKPEAADMLHMMWDNGLALVAEDYAAQCIWEHNQAVMNELGENLYITTGTLSLNKSMAKWFDEQKNYDYASNTCETGMCGHYTQVVWAKSSGVGCATHLCRTVEYTDYKNATILVCNYYPPGNVVGKHPYESGVPCSKCPETAIECIGNTCAHIEISVTEETGLDTQQTEKPWTQPVSSTGFTNLSVATLLLVGLMIAFIF
ncbi:peptidase inhibitor 16-like [Hemibagrus wyckioides]|uniref:peptidase inhibitor 16-like n=1 Tax=Hemibagrus wyckioides TaxID=337641 RepID=UPI00266BFC92|nr:peptidase inhibitor 16-like [Hemibagrus wyckioides]